MSVSQSTAQPALQGWEYSCRCSQSTSQPPRHVGRILLCCSSVCHTVFDPRGQNAAVVSSVHYPTSCTSWESSAASSSAYVTVFVRHWKKTGECFPSPRHSMRPMLENTAACVFSLSRNSPRDERRLL